MVIFGDSLSDDGYLYEHDGHLLPKSPPYSNGRFTNGNVWVDTVENYYRDKRPVTIEDYAVAGETAVYHKPWDGFVPYSLQTSVEHYLMDNMIEDRSQTLFVFWIGSNDYLNGANNPDEVTTQVVNKIVSEIRLLIRIGAKKFMIIDVPDLSNLPYAELHNEKDVLAELCRLHNIKLEAAIKKLQEQYPNVQFHWHEISQLFNSLIAQPEAFNLKYQLHITDTHTPCWTGGYTYDDSLPDREEKNGSEAFISYVKSNPDLAETFSISKGFQAGAGTRCQNEDDHVFWDHVHPTRVVHQIISSLMIENLNQIN